MKPSILVVMLDFLVCSLLLFVIGTGGKQTQFATSAMPPAGGTVHEEFSPTAIAAMQEQWNRDYDQQVLLAQLNARSAENLHLRETVQSLSGRLDETSAALANREQEAESLKTLTAQREQALRALDESVKTLSVEKARVEQEKSKVEKSLASTETQLAHVSAEQGRLQQEKAELQQRAGQLGQTVASQQATIQTLSEGVRASQEKMETQFADFATGQQQMAATLGRLDEFARTLPAMVQSNVASVQDRQRSLQDDIAALEEAVHDLQAGLKEGERGALMQAITDVAKGQQGLESQLAGLIKEQGGEQIGKSLTTIQSGQDALRQQTARLAEQMEAIQARKPGPFQAVKASRLELHAALAKRDRTDSASFRFNRTAYPPVAKVGDRLFIVTTDQNLGLGWALETDFSISEITELKYTIGYRGDPPWSASLDGSACLLRVHPHVVAVELGRLPPGFSGMELAGADKLFRSDQNKLYVFKSTLAGLSFEVDASPDLAASDYLVVKRPLRGIASWFENPAYRPDAGDYVVTSDGKLVGLMVNRERCLILGRDNILDCSLDVPLADKQQWPRVAKQFQKLR